MGKHWALSIGINHYQSFQPLHYARQDAEAVHRFLIEEVGLPADHCLLLTETAPDYHDRVMLPQGDTILGWLQWLCNQVLQPDDRLWVFFGGYGVCWEGEDYWMPWDGDPNRVPETGLAVRSLLHLLHGAPTRGILLILDMNRSQGVLSPTLPGRQTAELAHQFGIATLISCQSDQFSYETAQLRQGLFTVAVLEGLRQHHLQTLGQLETYLNDRLPKLCDHYWRPEQTAVSIGARDLRLYGSVSQEAVVGSRAIPTFRADRFDRSDRADRSSDLATTPETDWPTDEELQSTRVPPDLGAFSPLPITELEVLGGNTNGWGDLTGREQRTESEKERNPSSRNPGNKDDRFVASILNPSAREFGLPSGLLSKGLWLALAVVSLWGGFKLYQTYVADNPQGTFRLFWFTASTPSPTPPTVQPSHPESPQPTLLESYPPEPVSSATSPLPQTFSEEAAKALRTRNRQILLRARSLVRDSQAFQFNEAIAQVRTIQPDEPFYEQAQQDIERWSQVIFDLALGRAGERDYPGAIAAASLVPSDQPIYNKAQKAIVYWQQLDQQQNRNQAYLEEARSVIQPGSGSSYNEGIRLAKRVPEGQPQFFEAQRLIGEWSGEILAIAEERAAQGRYTEAIEAAQLIPPEMPHYEVAQARIKEWQSK
jgi:hypothetical protein